ncbi:MAG: glutamate--tRNA ligase [Rhodospirillales bacterium]
MNVVTRFAPSPTGYLHIGGARTALFNWLHARRTNGRFLLRIEDTDRARSSQEAVDKIHEGLRWLGLDWDGEAVSQFARRERHAEAAHGLLEAGKAYRCYTSQEELTAMRKAAKDEKRTMRYDGRWRDRDPSDAPAGVDPVIRFKAPQDGETVINDLVQGDVTVGNSELDDMVLLRADGTPTYMLAVVVDDHDMDVTDIVRGDDHLTNAFRQTQLFRALGWKEPRFAHIPLIHGPDGKKYSKRHGALGIEAYRDMGFLPEAMRNYLLRLGWGHGDEEIISDADARAWFDLKDVGKAPARFDIDKLNNLNGHYIRAADNARLAEMVLETLAADEALAHADAPGGALAETAVNRVKQGMDGLKQRAKNINELTENARFYAASRPLELDEAACGLLKPEDARSRLGELNEALRAAEPWSAEALEALVRDKAAAWGVKLGQIAQPLRAALTGQAASPPVFDVMCVLGREETMGRIEDAVR